MRGTRHESEDALFLYSEDTLEGSERERVEAHVSACAVCEGIVREFRILGAALTAATPETAPSRVVNVIAQASQPSQTPSASTALPKFTFFRKDRKMNAETTTASSHVNTGIIPMRRKAMRWQWVTVLVASLLLGGAAGMWMTDGKAAKDTAWEHYQKAAAAYQKKDMTTAINEQRQAQKGVLIVQTLQEGGSRQYATLRDLARKNADYAMSLANQGQKDNAINMTELNLSMADQLCNSGRFIDGLVAVAIYQLTGQKRVDIYRIAGTDKETQDETRRLQARQEAFKQNVKPEIDAFIKDSPTLGRGEAAAREKDIVGKIVNAWRLSAPE